MKIAICSQGDTLNAKVDSRFGRCPYFFIVDTETQKAEPFKNPSVMAGHGAGVGAVQFLASQGVEAVCATNVGPNAYSALQAAGISAYSVGSLTVAEVIEKFKQGLLNSIQNPNVPSHHGIQK